MGEAGSGIDGGISSWVRFLKYMKVSGFWSQVGLGVSGVI